MNLGHNHHEPAVPFDWKTVIANDETSGERKESIEDIKELLLFLSSYIFLPPPRGPRKHRDRLIATRSLAAFSVLLGSQIGTDNISALLRASGLKVQRRTLMFQMNYFERYIQEIGGKEAAIKKILTQTKKG